MHCIYVVDLAYPKLALIVSRLASFNIPVIAVDYGDGIAPILERPIVVIVGV